METYIVLIEIASYPKSGNTWVKHIMAELFRLNASRHIPDYHQKKNETSRLVKYIDYWDEKVGFYKSHIPGLPFMSPDCIIMIYRHPLDVFLSCMNYFYIRGRNDILCKSRKSLSVAEMGSDLERYFDDFLENAGSNYFQSMLSEKSNYFAYMDTSRLKRNVVFLKYEELFDFPEREVDRVSKEVFGERAPMVNEEILARVNNKTKYSGAEFFWRARPGGYREYLKQSWIEDFYRKYSSELSWLRY